ncbi:Geranylgeranyl transferase type-2 subunit alpha [Bienertia sinuspersici]
MLAVLTLVEANTLLVPKLYPGSFDRIVSTDCQRDAVDLLLKASGYLEFCVQKILPKLSPDIKNKLHKDMQESALESLFLQALGQGTESQLGLAIENQKATLSVKRRLACEQQTFFTQAAAYFYHGLIVDKSNEPSSHTNALCCLVAAEELLLQSKKACLTFCLASPVTRAPPLWGAMKHLHQKIPDIVAKKSQMYSYLLNQEKGLQPPPDLPEFQLSLRPDDYELPEIDSFWCKEKWEFIGQPLKEHLKDSEDVIE